MARIRQHEWPGPSDSNARCVHCQADYAGAMGTGRVCVWRDGPDPGTALAPEPARRQLACEDADTICRRIAIIRAYERHECFARAGRSQSECWCYLANPLGGSIPCPPPIPA